MQHKYMGMYADRECLGRGNAARRRSQRVAWRPFVGANEVDRQAECAHCLQLPPQADMKARKSQTERMNHEPDRCQPRVRTIHGNLCRAGKRPQIPSRDVRARQPGRAKTASVIDTIIQRATCHSGSLPVLILKIPNNPHLASLRVIRLQQRCNLDSRRMYVHASFLHLLIEFAIGEADEDAPV
jgi:hypothetical protein